MKKVIFFIAVAVTILSSCKNVSDATVEDIQKACEKEDWHTAKEMCEAYMKKDRLNPVVLKSLGDAYLGLKDSAFALYSYDQAVVLDSMYVDAIVGSADVLMNGGSAPLAISRLRTRMEYIPDNAQLHNALGCAFRITENANEAQANFERAVLLDPNYALARKNLAIVQIDNRDFEDAILNLETVLDENPNQADAYNYMGLAYFFKDNSEKAEELFLKSISIDGKYLPAIENIAYFYNRNGDLDKAKKYYEKAANLGSKNAMDKLKKQQMQQ